MTKEIYLRPAAADDARILGHLWAVTFPDKFGPVLGEHAEAVLSDWLRLSRRHLHTTTVATIEGVAAGFIVLETAARPRPNDGRWLWRALQLHYGLFGAVRGLLLTLLLDSRHRCGRNEMYIEMLGVAPGWRNLGIACRLLAHAETTARANQMEYLTLEVVSDNTPALRLYEKMGFKITAKKQSLPLKWVTGHPGYFEMTKRLDIT